MAVIIALESRPRRITERKTKVSYPTYTRKDSSAEREGMARERGKEKEIPLSNNNL